MKLDVSQNGYLRRYQINKNALETWRPKLLLLLPKKTEKSSEGFSESNLSKSGKNYPRAHVRGKKLSDTIAFDQDAKDEAINGGQNESKCVCVFVCVCLCVCVCVCVCVWIYIMEKIGLWPR